MKKVIGLISIDDCISVSQKITNKYISKNSNILGIYKTNQGSVLCYECDYEQNQNIKETYQILTIWNNQVLDNSNNFRYLGGLVYDKNVLFVYVKKENNYDDFDA